MRCGAGTLPSVHDLPRVQRVTQPVAYEIDAEHHHKNGDAGSSHIRHSRQNMEGLALFSILPQDAPAADSGRGSLSPLLTRLRKQRPRLRKPRGRNRVGQNMAEHNLAGPAPMVAAAREKSVCFSFRNSARSSLAELGQDST